LVDRISRQTSLEVVWGRGACGVPRGSPRPLRYFYLFLNATSAEKSFHLKTWIELAARLCYGISGGNPHW